MIHSDNDFATVAFLRVKSAELEPKIAAADRVASIPPLLEERFEAIKDAVADFQQKVASNSVASLQNESYSRHITLPASLSRRKDRWIVISNVQADIHNGGDLTIEEEVTQCFNILAGKLYTQQFFGDDLIASRTSRFARCRFITVHHDKCINFIHGSVPSGQCRILHILWHQPACPRLYLR